MPLTSAKPTTLYRDFAVAWNFSGVMTVRARSPAEAQTKFDKLSQATVFNQSAGEFWFRTLVGDHNAAD